MSFAIYTSKASFPNSRRTAMKFETLMLKSLFTACMLVCVLTLGAMLTTKVKVNVPTVVASHAAAASVANSAS
jgi:mannose/fructose/N-acetylgalactosamine-specific phosphotransferase system component IID